MIQEAGLYKPGISFLRQIVDKGIHKWKFKYTPNGKHSYNTTLGIWKVNHKRMNLCDNLHNTRPKGALYAWVINYKYLITGGDYDSRDCPEYGQLKCRGGEHMIEMI